MTASMAVGRMLHPPPPVLGFAAPAAEADAGAAAADPSPLAAGPEMLAAIAIAPTGPHDGHLDLDLDLDPDPAPYPLNNDDGGDEEGLPLEAGPLQPGDMDHMDRAPL